MTLSVFRYEFTVNSVPVTVDTSTRVNVKKRHENFIYRTASNRDNINISYIVGEEVTPTNNLTISDRSTSLVQNRVPSATALSIDTTSSFDVNVEKFIVTDTFSTETPTKPETPLFYVHTLFHFNADNDDWADKTLQSIRFLDYELNPIDFSEYSLSSSTGKVYNNIENSYDSATTNFDVTYIQYTVRTTTDGVSATNIYHELIGNDQVYEQATFDDIDEFGNLITGRKKYLVQEAPGGGHFAVSLPESAKYAWKELSSSRIKILPPIAEDLSSPWYLRVSNGKFIASLRTGINSSSSYKYHIAEHSSQTFYPYPPYKQIQNQKAIWLGKSLIKVPKGTVLDTGLGLHIDVIIKDQYGTTKAAHSTDPDKTGTYFSTGIAYEDGILSVDRTNGFIEIDRELLDSDEIIATYYVEEDEYEFTSIDFNPTNNLEILNQRVVLYLSPEYTSTGELDTTLYYLIVDPQGKITYSSHADENSTGIDPATQRLASEDFNSDGLPTHDFYYDTASTESGLQSRASGWYSQFVDEFSFVDKYTVESILLDPTSTPSGTLVDSLLENFTANSRFLVLADVYTGEGSAPEGLSEFDVRIRGGGIKDDVIDESLDQQGEVSWYWDLNARKPYPGVGSFIVEVPRTVLDIYGGDFTKKEVQDIVHKHAKAGAYAIVKDYGYIEPTITDTTAASGLVSLTFPSYGSGLTYNVYHSTEEDRDFTLWSIVKK